MHLPFAVFTILHYNNGVYSTKKKDNYALKGDNMKWLEILVHTTTEAQELVSDLLINNGANGTSILDRAYIPDVKKYGTEWEMYDESLLEMMPEDVEVHAWFEINDALPHLLHKIQNDLLHLQQQTHPFSLGSLQMEQKSVDDADWKDVWKQYYKPLRIGRNIIVKPSWEDYAKQEKDIVIELDPGMAFGTGAHATTYMCLELLEKFINPNTSVIDIGTGSGILAIASALLGAKDVLGVDINEDAVLVAKENVAKNGLINRIRIQKSDLLQNVDGKCEIAVANIIADAVLMLTPDVKHIIKDKGIYIVSGILQEREPEIIHTAELQGYRLLEILHRDEWSGIAFRYEG